MSVNVLLTTGKWFEVEKGEVAQAVGNGCLVVHGQAYETETETEPDKITTVTTRDIIRVFGPGAWVTWDEEER